MIALGSVVEHHVEDHLDACGVKSADHLLELADLGARLGRRGVAPMRGEEGQWVVAPVVASAGALHRGNLGSELMNRHQFHCRHAQRLEIGNLLDHAQVAAGVLDAARRALREPAHVHLVDHGVGQTAPQVTISLPVEGVVHHHALGRPQQAVGSQSELAAQGPGVGVDESGPAVEPLAAFRIERPLRLEVIELPWPHSRHEDAPDVAPAVLVGIEDDHLGRLEGVRRVVEQHPHGRRRTAVDHELHALVVEHRAVGQPLAELQRRWRCLGGPDRLHRTGLLPRRHAGIIPTGLPPRRRPGGLAGPRTAAKIAG